MELIWDGEHGHQMEFYGWRKGEGNCTMMRVFSDGVWDRSHWDLEFEIGSLSVGCLRQGRGSLKRLFGWDRGLRSARSRMIPNV